MGRLHRGGSCSSSRVRARGSAPRPGRGGGPRRLPPDPLAASFLFPVGDVGAAAPPAGDLQGLDPRPGRVDSRRDGCVRRGRDLVRWARAGFGAVIDLVVSQVCKERCRRWGQKRACRAHLSELARAVRSDRTGAFSPSPPHPLPRGPLGGGSDGRPKDDRVSWIRPGAAMPRARVPMGWKSMQAGEGEDAGRPGRPTWAHRCSAGRRPRRPVRHNDRLRSGLEGPGR